MELILPILAGVISFAVLFLFLGPKLFDKSGSKRKHDYIRNLEANVAGVNAANLKLRASNDSYFKDSTDGILVSLVNKIPYFRNVPSLLLRSGKNINISSYFLITGLLIFILISTFETLGFGNIGMIMAVALGIIIPKKYISYLVDKRTDEFINMFPDAIDMIVRSVKSGHPLNTALKMIADNMEPPVSTEFRQVVDEVAYGRTLTDSLYRLSERIDQTDLAFFVVVLAVQQETGGNLAEVLGNLSNIIRKRKQLRLKIKALTSEARFTGWILGSLPFFLMLAIRLTSPTYLTPLFEDERGKVVLMVALTMVGGALLAMKKMVKVDI